MQRQTETKRSITRLKQKWPIRPTESKMENNIKNPLLDNFFIKPNRPKYEKVEQALTYLYQCTYLQDVFVDHEHTEHAYKLIKDYIESRG